MNSSSAADAIKGMPIGILLAAIAIGLILGLVLHIFISYCYKRICLKAGHEPGALVWIPIAQFVPLLTIAGLPLWWIILLFIPCVGIFVWLYIWYKIAFERLGHSILFFIGIILLWIVFIPILAFIRSPNQAEQAQ